MKSLFSFFAVVTLSLSAHAGKVVRETTDAKFSEFQFITAAYEAQNENSDRFIFVQRQGFDSPDSYMNIVLSVAPSNGEGPTNVYELPVSGTIVKGSISVQSDGATFTTSKIRYGTRKSEIVQTHHLILERDKGELTGKMAFTSKPPQER